MRLIVVLGNRLLLTRSACVIFLFQILIDSTRKGFDFFIFILIRGVCQTDNPKTVLSAQRVYGGGGKFKVYKNAMDIKGKSIYHSTTSFIVGKKCINGPSASDTQEQILVFLSKMKRVRLKSYTPWIMRIKRYNVILLRVKRA